jgi:hypothetical protein
LDVKDDLIIIKSNNDGDIDKSTSTTTEQGQSI